VHAALHLLGTLAQLNPGPFEFFGMGTFVLLGLIAGPPLTLFGFGPLALIRAAFFLFAVAFAAHFALGVLAVALTAGFGILLLSAKWQGESGGEGESNESLGSHGRMLEWGCWQPGK
jgi:hypothetical protein